MPKEYLAAIKNSCASTKYLTVELIPLAHIK
jgi:hypothetical protein